MKKNHLSLFFMLFAFVIFIWDGKHCTQYAYEGILYCLNTVIPSLFPIMLLCGFIMQKFQGENCQLIKRTGKLFRLPDTLEALWIPAFLGGYPVGAQYIIAYRTILGDEESARLLKYCSNPGPAFIFGITLSLFHSPYIPWILWGIVFLSGLSVCCMIPYQPHGSLQIKAPIPQKQDPFQSCIGSLKIICGWIILFHILTEFLHKWILWILPANYQIIFYGFLELANGCMRAKQLSSEACLFVLIAAWLSFGGICVAMQTYSIVGSKLFKSYLLGKIAGCCYSIIYAILLVPILFPGKLEIEKALAAGSVCGIMIVLTYIQIKKSSRNYLEDDVY